MEDGYTVKYLPAELLRDLNIVDTPGTNVILERQQRLTEEYVPRADMVLFTMSAGGHGTLQCSVLHIILLMQCSHNHPCIAVAAGRHACLQLKCLRWIDVVRVAQKDV